ECLPDGEPHDLPRDRIREDVERRIAVAAQAAIEDGEERIDEEEAEKRERHAVRQGPPAARAHLTTMSVHRSTQRSRFSLITRGDRSSGCSGTTANFSNSGGTAASRRAG